MNKLNLIIGTIVIALTFGMTTVLANSPGKTSKMNIVEIASADAQFSILVDAVVKAELVDALSAAGPYTVFAPTNDAFNDLFKSLGVNGIDDLSKEQLKPILLYHVVEGEVWSKDISSGKVATLNNTASIDVEVMKNTVKINKSKVVAADIDASNGVIHVIDKVLIPEVKTSSKSKGGC